MPVELVIRFMIFSCKVDCFALLDGSFFDSFQIVSKISIPPKTVPELGPVAWGLNWVRINRHYAEPRTKHRRPCRQFIVYV